MKYFWKNAYSVQNDLLDSQHKKIFELLNELEEMTIQYNEEKIIEILNSIDEDLSEHFRTEEGLMKDVVPDSMYEDHCKEHVFFINEIKKLKANISIFISLELINMLRDLIISHLLGTDQEYIPYLKD